MKSGNITKLEIVGAIYDHVVWSYQNANKPCRVIKSDVAFIVDDFLKEISKAMIGGRTAEFRGFGTFQLKRRRAKSNSRNPKSGEPVQTKDHYIPVFRPGMELKRSVKLISEENDVFEE